MKTPLPKKPTIELTPKQKPTIDFTRKAPVKFNPYGYHVDARGKSNKA